MRGVGKVKPKERTSQSSASKGTSPAVDDASSDDDASDDDDSSSSSSAHAPTSAASSSTGVDAITATLTSTSLSNSPPLNGAERAALKAHLNNNVAHKDALSKLAAILRRLSPRIKHFLSLLQTAFTTQNPSVLASAAQDLETAQHLQKTYNFKPDSNLARARMAMHLAIRLLDAAADKQARCPVLTLKLSLLVWRSLTNELAPHQACPDLSRGFSYFYRVGFGRVEVHFKDGTVDDQYIVIKAVGKATDGLHKRLFNEQLHALNDLGMTSAYSIGQSDRDLLHRLLDSPKTEHASDVGRHEDIMLVWPWYDGDEETNRYRPLFGRLVCGHGDGGPLREWLGTKASIGPTEFVLCRKSVFLTIQQDWHANAALAKTDLWPDDLEEYLLQYAHDNLPVNIDKVRLFKKGGGESFDIEFDHEGTPIKAGKHRKPGSTDITPATPTQQGGAGVPPADGAAAIGSFDEAAGGESKIKDFAAMPAIAASAPSLKPAKKLTKNTEEEEEESDRSKKKGKKAPTDNDDSEDDEVEEPAPVKQRKNFKQTFLVPDAPTKRGKQGK